MTTLRYIILLSTFYTIFFIRNVHCQDSLFRYDNIKVKVDNQWLRNPWAGGLNSVQFSKIDLNHDSIDDLFVFDRCGNRITTYINKGASNTVDYVHAPEYQSMFPELLDWVLLADYNYDGKADIFTSSMYISNGMSVYMNTSDTVQGLQFDLVEPVLYVFDTPIITKLKIIPMDYPAVTDIDSDGDLDILSFGDNLMANKIVYFKNQSMELYGIPDSLTFKVKNRCWGYFSENTFSNNVVLNDSCKAWNVPNPEKGGVKHIGSTLLGLDLDGNGVKDLILGDIGSNSLLALTNGGTTNSSGMISQDTTFPSYDQPVNLDIFPAGFYIDVNNDGKRDLIVSTNNTVSSSYPSVWYYSNDGTDISPHFVYQTNTFLQDQMIETGRGANPVLFDANSDGLPDLLIGNLEYYKSGGVDSSGISYYKNMGDSANPAFELITRDYEDIISLGLKNVSPAFGDLDNDGDKDMVIGDANGMLHYLENTAAAGNEASFTLVFNPNIDTIDVGNFAAPQIIDVNRDGLLDLIIGEKNGNINYYNNGGTVTTPDFSLVSDSFGNVSVKPDTGTSGYSTPFLYDDSGKYVLLTGSVTGNIYKYNNIDNNLSGAFTLVDTFYSRIREGVQTCIHGGDINYDGFFDLFVGNLAGGVALYTQDTIVDTLVHVSSIFKEQHSFLLFPNPVNDEMTVQINNAEISSSVYYEIINILGQRVQTGTIHSKETIISCKQIPNGLYFCKLSSDTPYIHQKFIVSHK